MITLKDRTLLEKYITKTVTVEFIAKLLGKSRASIYAELKKGLPEGESDMRMYKAKIAQEKVEHDALKKLRGE